MTEDCLTEAILNGIEAPMTFGEFCIEKKIPEDSNSSNQLYRDYYIDFAETGGA